MFDHRAARTKGAAEDRRSAFPADRAIGWMIALVAAPTAISATIAVSREAEWRTSAGLSYRRASSTIWRPDTAAMRQCEASLAGIEDAPSNVRPRVSAIAVIVGAVPI